MGGIGGVLCDVVDDLRRALGGGDCEGAGREEKHACEMVWSVNGGGLGLDHARGIWGNHPIRVGCSDGDVRRGAQVRHEIHGISPEHGLSFVRVSSECNKRFEHHARLPCRF